MFVLVLVPSARLYYDKLFYPLRFNTILVFDDAP
jgi:hypothetical protein